MAKCKDCRYWHLDRESDILKSEIGLCSKAAMLWDVSVWDDGYNRVLLPEHKDLMMFVKDGSEYHAELLTVPHFYCAHFEPREPVD